MALKSEYKTTRGDAKRLAKDVRPGDRLYVVHDVSASVAPYEDAQLYGEFVVTSDRALDFTGTLMVRSASASGRGSMSIAGLLGKFGTVYTSPPAGVRSLRDQKPVVNDRQIATYATRVHEADAAEDRRNRRQPAAAGKKRGWF